MKITKQKKLHMIKVFGVERERERERKASGKEKSDESKWKKQITMADLLVGAGALDLSTFKRYEHIYVYV